MGEPSTASIEELLAHREWVRTLAIRLVRDANTAADLEQETWLAATRSRVRGETARAWLSAVLRRSAGRVARTAQRRERRETAAVAASRGAEESTLDSIVRAEAHERVVRAVMSLEEPYRTTVVLRFFDGLPPRAVARRMGVPVETARARVRRGLEQVRARLARMHGGDGPSWRAALLPLALSGRIAGTARDAHLAKGAFLMAKGTAVVAGVTLAAGLAIGWGVAGRRADAAVAAALTEAESSRIAAQRASDQAVAALQLRLDQSIAREHDLEQCLREASEALEKAQREPDAAAAAPASEAVGEAPSKGPRFPFPQFPVFNMVEWPAIGAEVIKALPATTEYAEAAKGKDPQAVADAYSKLGEAVFGVMGTIIQLEHVAPGTGGSGAFTNPAFQLNVIAAALDKAGKPLDDDQVRALAQIGRDFTAEDTKRLAGYPDSTFQLRREIDEADLRRRFFDAARAAVSEAQRRILWPDAVRDQGSLDVLSDGTFLESIHAPLESLCAPVVWKDRDELVSKMTEKVVDMLELDDERLDAVRNIVASWVQAFPPTLLETRFTGIADRGVPTPALREGMRQTLALYERLVKELALDAEATEAVRWVRQGFVPVQAPADR